VELMARVRRVARLLADPHTPRLPRLAVLLAALYLLVPMDLLPEFVFPIVGYIDDLGLVWLSLRWLLKSGSTPDPSLPDPER
jgi:uncharacterized membrane protein YkvA (DUF1232 family)